MRKIIFTLTSMLISIISYGQNCDCSELLKYGVYNHFSSTENVQNFNEIQKAVSNSYTKQSKGGGGASVGYAGFSGSYNKSESDMLQKIATNQSLEKSDLEKLKSQSASYVSSEMMSSYRECMRLCETKGLQSNSDFPTDGRFSSISFTIEYKRPPNVKRHPVLNSIQIGPNDDCYTCKGDLMDLAIKKDTVRENTIYKMTCIRNIKSKPFKLLGTDKNVYATEAHISIQTDMGDYDLRIPPLFAKNPEFDKGMGEIIASMLTEEKFIATYGSDWRLANGDEAPLTSSYRKYIDENLPHLNGKLPDLRGAFLRGFNNGTSINPENKLIGQFQSDEFKTHNHPLNLKGNDKNGGDCTSTLNGCGSGSKPKNLNSGSIGGQETRPKNVTVNYFIKIN